MVLSIAAALSLVLAGIRPVPPPDPVRICLAPAAVESGIGSVDEAVRAVTEAFTTYLTGPTLTVAPLSARLPSQVRQEASAAGCPYLLLPTLKHVRKTGTGSGFLSRMAGSAVQQVAAAAGASTSSTVGRIAANAAAGAAGVAAYNYSTSVKTKDEMTLAVRLEALGGRAIVERSDKRKAQSDGEDLLTPLVEQAAEAVAAAVSRGTH